MENEEFLRLCKAKVAEYTNSHMDKTDGKQITVQDVYVVWSCKTLQNSKALVGRMGNRSAVANNNQIIAGIRAGVFEAVVNAFESMQGRNDRGQELHIYLEGDAKKLFKVIRQEGNNYQKQTGNPVFG